VTYKAHVSSFCVELKSDCGVLGNKTRHCRDQDPIGYNGHCRHANHACRCGVPISDAVLQIIYVSLNLSSASNRRLSHPRRQHGAINALKEATAKDGFNGSEPSCDRGLIHGEAPPSARHGASSTDREDVPEVIPEHGLHFCRSRRQISRLF
jgi:hypothetical protein